MEGLQGSLAAQAQAKGVDEVTDIGLPLLVATGFLCVLVHALAAVEVWRGGVKPMLWTAYLLLMSVLYGVLTYSYTRLLIGKRGPSEHLELMQNFLGHPLLLNAAVLAYMLARSQDDV